MRVLRCSVRLAEKSFIEANLSPGIITHIPIRDCQIMYTTHRHMLVALVWEACQVTIGCVFTSWLWGYSWWLGSCAAAAAVWTGILRHTLFLREWAMRIPILPTEVRLCVALGLRELFAPHLSTITVEEAKRRRQALQQWAYRHNPLYHKLYYSYYHSNKTIAWEDLPIVTKTMLRDAVDAGTALSRGYASAAPWIGFWVSTSGSTGVPMSSFRSWSEQALRDWYEIRDLLKVAQLAAFRPVGRCIAWHAGHSNNWWCYSPRTYLLESMGCRSLCEELQTLQNDYIYMPLSNALAISRHVMELSDTGRGKSWMPPQAVFTDSELSSKEQRGWISKALKAPVYDCYAAEEAFIIAQECREGRYHVPVDEVWLDIVDDDGVAVDPGVVGRVLVTNLLQKSMPLIRYEIGDLASWSADGKCPCGWAFPCLENIHGRHNDTFTLPSGEKLSVYQLTAFTSVSLELEKTIGAWQVVQLSTDLVEARVTPRPPCGRADAQRGGEVLLRAVQKAFPSGCRVRFSVKVFDTLPRHPRGKRCNFLSLVKD